MLGIQKAGLALLIAVSSVVYIEPAPYDVLALGMVVFFFASGLKTPRGISTPFLLLLLMYSGFALSTGFNDIPEAGYKALGIRIYLILTWLLFASLVYRQPKQVMDILWHAYIIAALVAVAWGFLEYFGYISIERWEGGLRAKGPFKDPNVYGPFIVPAAVFSIYRSMSSKYALLYLPVAAILMFGILISFSRGAWINTALSLTIVGLGVMLSKHSKQQVTQVFLIGSISMLFVVAGLVAAVNNKTVASRFEQRTSVAQNYDMQKGGRFDTQKRVLYASLEKPIGFGAGSTQIVFGLEPHNIYLHILAEGGWLAFFGWISFVLVSVGRAGNTLLQSRELPGNLLIIFACSVGLLVQSFFIDSTHWRHLYLIFGLLWGLTLAQQHANARKSPPHTNPKLAGMTK